MRLLLTSAGVTNASIRAALVDLLPRPICECDAICIPTAIYGLPGGPGDAWLTLREFERLGWREFGVLELTALATAPEECWVPTLEGADCIIVGGGNTGYLAYWMRESGLAARLPALLWEQPTTVYLGVSAGSMIVTHSLQMDQDVLARTGIYVDLDYDEAAPPHAGGDETLELVDFVIRPHLNAEYFPTATPERFAESAATLDVPLYAFDDETALAVTNGQVRVISEGKWILFEPGGHHTSTDPTR